MPLLPIDLQTIFARMNQVGREQAIQKSLAPETQAFQASEIVRRTEERDNSVNESQEVTEGPEPVKEEEEKSQTRQEAENQGKEKKGRETDKEVFEDPDLGHHIDISG
jgi:hypothetical protein